MDNLSKKMNEIPEKTINKCADDFIIAIIGTVDSRKNQQKFIDNVFYKCKDKYPNIKLLLVGDVHERPTINSQYNDSIIILGLVNNALPYIKMSDIIVSYSTNEVFPLNIMESFYCRKSVIASNVGGVSEMINNNENGFLIEINDSNNCFNKLCELIENENLRNKIGEKSYKTFVEKYDDNVVFKDFLLLLSKK